MLRTVVCVGLASGMVFGLSCSCSSSSGAPVPAADSGEGSANVADGKVDRTETGIPCTPKPYLRSLVSIPSGTFIVGSPPTQFGHPPYDQDQLQVTLTHPFELGATELTQAEWSSLCVPNPSGKDGFATEDCIGPDCPVGRVTWFDAIAWLNMLSKHRGLPECYKLNDCSGATGENLKCQTVEVLAPTIYECAGYRLPTEFEFEYASRAGTTTAFYSGDITPVSGDPDTCVFDANLDPIGWYCFNSGLITHPVAQKIPNGWGLYDIVGNSLEWTHSKYSGKGYGVVPLVDPPGTVGTIQYGDSPSARGGLYNFSSRTATAAWRLEISNWGRGAGLGFRVARTLPRVDAGSSDASGD